MGVGQATQGRRDLSVEGVSVIVFVMVLLDGIANGVGLVDHLVVFVHFGFFLFLVTFVLFFTHDGGSVDF